MCDLCSRGFATADLENSARIRKIWQFALSGQKRMFGDNAFAYWFQSLGPASVTLWAFVVYRCTGFIGLTRPKTENAEESALPEEERGANGCL